MKTTITLLFILILYFAVDLSGGGDRTGLPVQIRVANDFTGADIGAKINAADAACGVNVGCEIWVLDGGSVAANTISTQVVVGSFHTLRFFEGTFYCNYLHPYFAPILMKDNSNLIGSGWNTIIVENNYPNVQVYNPANGLGTLHPAGYAVVGMYNSQFSCSPGASNITCRASDVHVSHIQFKGVRSNQFDSGVTATIGFANGYRMSVTHCWFNEVAGYAANFGGTQADTPEDDQTVYPDGRVSANYARDGWFTDNLMTNLQSQWVGVTTAENIRIERNIFREAGKRPYKILSVTNPAGAPIVITVDEPHHFFAGMYLRLRNVTATGGAIPISNDTDYLIKPIPGEPTKFSLHTTQNTGTTQKPIYLTDVNGNGRGSYTVNATSKTDWRAVIVVAIDFEPNGSPAERVGGHSVIGNLFDFRVVNGIYATAIVYQPTNAKQLTEGSIIANNTIIGNELGTGAMSYGIVSNSNTKGLTITNNSIKNANAAGIAASGDRVMVSNNMLFDCGGGGIGSMTAIDLTNSTVSDNTIRNVAYGQSIVQEAGIGTNNVWKDNTVNLHVHNTGSTITNSLYKDNYWIKGIVNQTGFSESANSNNNIYDGNITNPQHIGSDAFGLRLYGTKSKVLRHSYNDGRVFMPNVITTAFNNPN